MGATSPVPPGRRVIESYGAGRFRVAGEVHHGAVLVLPDRVVAWSIIEIAAMTADSLAPILAVEPRPEILLIGCGSRTAFVPPALRQELRAAGITIDAMDTGAACRTYNVLVTEERRVAAALIAVD
jgi:uncharacterized protein